jgi:hypothetical protein
MVPAGLLDLLDDCAELARTARAERAATSVTTSEGLPSFEGSVLDVAGSSRWITTAQAADRLSITTRGVVDLLQSDQPRLIGRQQTARGRWEVDADSVRRYAEIRQARKAGAA